MKKSILVTVFFIFCGSVFSQNYQNYNNTDIDEQYRKYEQQQKVDKIISRLEVLQYQLEKEREENINELRGLLSTVNLTEDEKEKFLSISNLFKQVDYIKELVDEREKSKEEDIKSLIQLGYDENKVRIQYTLFSSIRNIKHPKKEDVKKLLDQDIRAEEERKKLEEEARVRREREDLITGVLSLVALIFGLIIIFKYKSKILKLFEIIGKKTFSLIFNKFFISLAIAVIVISVVVSNNNKSGYYEKQRLRDEIYKDVYDDVKADLEAERENSYYNY